MSIRADLIAAVQDELATEREILADLEREASDPVNAAMRNTLDRVVGLARRQIARLAAQLAAMEAG